MDPERDPERMAARLSSLESRLAEISSQHTKAAKALLLLLVLMRDLFWRALPERLRNTLRRHVQELGDELAGHDDLFDHISIEDGADFHAAGGTELLQPDLHMVSAAIKPFKLNEVTEALKELDINGMTVYEVKGFGKQRGHSEIYRGAEYVLDFLPKVLIHVIAPRSEVRRIKDAIIHTARTGKIGDGLIWSSRIEGLYRIRTGERDSELFHGDG